MKNIIIGIVSKHVNADLKELRIRTHIIAEVKQAIFDNGGIAIGILSPNDNILFFGDKWEDKIELLDKENIINQIKLCDGIILQGGDQNELFETFIAKYCYDNDIPILGICAGQNSIVRALGGSIKKISNPEKHFRLNEMYVHSIKIDKTSKFYKIINKENIMVNSRHERTADETPLLDKVAFCEDGYPDVVEAKNKKFYIGVRFHPESMYKEDSNMKKLFEEFINICKK